MKIRKGDRQYYLNKEGDTFHLVKRVKTFNSSRLYEKRKQRLKHFLMIFLMRRH